MYVKEQFRKIDYIKGVITLAADDDLIVTAVDMKVGAYTIAAQPYLGSRLSFTVTAGDTADTMGTIVVVGSLGGVAISETVTPIAGDVVWTTNYFDALTSITGVGWVIDGEEGTKDTIKVGVGAVGKIPVMGREMTFKAQSGNIWIRPEAVAVADATSFKLVANDSVDLTCSQFLYVISDNDGATLQYVYWGE